VIQGNFPEELLKGGQTCSSNGGRQTSWRVMEGINNDKRRGWVMSSRRHEVPWDRTQDQPSLIAAETLFFLQSELLGKGNCRGGEGGVGSRSVEGRTREIECKCTSNVVVNGGIGASGTRNPKAERELTLKKVSAKEQSTTAGGLDKKRRGT